MATKTVRVSDISGNQIPEEQAAVRLIVEHPDFPEPVGLDVLEDEVEPILTDENARFVVVFLQTPDNQNPQRHILSIDDFDSLFDSGDSTSALQVAYQTQQQEREDAGANRRRGRRRTTAASTQERIDYSSPEHAGMPHRGTISEAEAEYVRNNLAEVNRRRREQGHPELDPNNPRTAARYGFPPPGADEPDEV